MFAYPTSAQSSLSLLTHCILFVIRITEEDEHKLLFVPTQPVYKTCNVQCNHL